MDLNHRPPGYEPDELPTALPRDVHFSAASGTAPEVLVTTRVMSPTSYQLLYPAIFCSVVPVTGLEPVQYRYRGILSPLCLPIPPHRQLSAMIRIPYSPVIVKHGQGKPFKFFRQLPLQKVQTGARFRAIFRPEAHILAENPNAKEEIK